MPKASSMALMAGPTKEAREATLRMAKETYSSRGGSVNLPLNSIWKIASVDEMQRAEGYTAIPLNNGATKQEYYWGIIFQKVENGTPVNEFEVVPMSYLWTPVQSKKKDGTGENAKIVDAEVTDHEGNVTARVVPGGSVAKVAQNLRGSLLHEVFVGISQAAQAKGSFLVKVTSVLPLQRLVFGRTDALEPRTSYKLDFVDAAGNVLP